MQVLVVPEEGKELPEGAAAQNGLTSAMRNARKRKFRQSRLVDPKVIREVEETFLKISGVSYRQNLGETLERSGYESAYPSLAMALTWNFTPWVGRGKPLEWRTIR